MSCVQSSEGGLQAVYPLGLWSRMSQESSIRICLATISHLRL